jgi:hypothetical protein
VAAGGLPVVDNSAASPKALHGIAVSEAANGFGMPVTKVTGKPGLPVIYVTPVIGNPLFAGAGHDRQTLDPKPEPEPEPEPDHAQERKSG